MFHKILIIGATGLLGRPVVDRLVEDGQSVRVLTRNTEKARAMFGDTVEIIEGSATDIDDVVRSMHGCDAVHINLSPSTEYTATRHVIEVALARPDRLGRLCYISATTLSEENRWFHRVDVKMRTEQLVRDSGLPYVIFRPTWVMETLQNFIRGDKWAVVVDGRNPPPLHFFAAADAASYDDDRALGESDGWSRRRMTTTGRWASACTCTARKGSRWPTPWIVLLPPATPRPGLCTWKSGRHDYWPR